MLSERSAPRKKNQLLPSFNFNYWLVCCTAALLLFSSCNNKETKETPATTKKVDNAVVQTEQKTVINYHLDSIANKAALDSFNHQYDSSQKLIIMALNRLSPGRVRVGSKIIIPDPLLMDIMQYSPYPSAISTLDSIPKVIIINQRFQAFGAYESGKLVRWGPTSTGRKAKPTPAGLQYTNYKARLKISTIDGDWKMPWYFNIQNKSGIGMHQFLLPGYPASHSCIRLLEEDAKFIFNWADQWQLSENGATVVKNGTPVIIFGTYAFGTTPPWKLLAEDPKAAQITEEDITAINSFANQIIK